MVSTCEGKNRNEMIDQTTGKDKITVTSHETQTSMSLANADWLTAPQTQAILGMLEKAGKGARVVGGAVRNQILGDPVSDIDIATTALPEEVMDLATARGFAAHPTGIDHGTVTVVCDHKPFEVTTLRKDVATDGRRATVAFTQDWAQDAQRRDFTINAIYCDRDGQVYDPVGGLADIANGCVRFIGAPVQRVREDYLRILRFFRFYATYGQGAIDEDGLGACVAEREGLTLLSGERIHMELFRLLVTPRAREAVRLLVKNEILEFLIGSDPAVDHFERLTEIEEWLGRDGDPLLRFAVLAARSEEDAQRFSAKLKLSREEQARLKRIAAIDSVADLNWPSDETTAKTGLYHLGGRFYVDRALAAWVRSSDETTNETRRRYVALAQDWVPPKLPFGGEDVIALGIAPGPDVGRVLELFEAWWVAEGFPDDPTLIKEKLRSFAAGL